MRTTLHFLIHTTLLTSALVLGTDLFAFTELASRGRQRFDLLLDPPSYEEENHEGESPGQLDDAESPSGRNGSTGALPDGEGDTADGSPSDGVSAVFKLSRKAPWIPVRRPSDPDVMNLAQIWMCGDLTCHETAVGRCSGRRLLVVHFPLRKAGLLTHLSASCVLPCCRNSDHRLSRSFWGMISGARYPLCTQGQ